jgi:type I restriction enzyme S subunit
MGLKQGYKQTEVGVIPEDWEVKNIGQVVSMSVGRDVDESCFSSIENAAFQYPVYSNTVSNRGLYGYYSTAEYYGESLTVVGRGVGLGTAFKRSGGYGAIGRLLVLHPNTDTDAGYLTEYINQRIHIFTESGGIPQLTGQSLSRYRVLVPPTKSEQEAIAEALSDADALIESLEQLLVKKRDIKKGAMQELLTGKKRLPGFSGEWTTKQLGDVGEISGSGVDKKLRSDELPVRLVNYMDAYRRDFIYGADLDHWVTAPAYKIRRCAVHKGDVFLTPSSETRDDIANSAVAMEAIPDAVYSYHLVCLRLREGWDFKFSAYAFKTRDFLDQAETLCDGSGTRYVISLGKFRSIQIKFPSFQEQEAIGSLLYDLDSEIAIVEAKLAKARQIKQGMMQELLTGRIRLI